MQYQGGKNRLAKYLAPLIAARADGCHTYLEPFMGSCAVLCAVAPLLPPSVTRIVGADAHEDLVLMWKHVQAGGALPSDVSEERYRELQVAAPSAERGFVGYACSFGAKWWGGYARNGKGDNYAARGVRATVAKAAVLAEHQVQLYHCTYDWMDPLIGPGVLVYCDPPYANTLPYKAVGAFDSSAFWKRMEAWSLAGATVLVSEFVAPTGWACLWSTERQDSTNNVNGSARSNVVDKLFTYTEKD